MPRPVRLAFAGAGLAHLTAVSGFHTGLVSAFVLVLLGAVGWPRRWRPVVLVPVVWAYVGVCGFPASALRAAAMATLAAVALSAQRQPDGLTFLSAAGMLLWVLSPHAVLDLGTGLSFLATAGILCLHASPVIRRTSRWRGVVLMAGVPLVAVALYGSLGLARIWAATVGVFAGQHFGHPLGDGVGGAFGSLVGPACRMGQWVGAGIDSDGRSPCVVRPMGGANPACGLALVFCGQHNGRLFAGIGVCLGIAWSARTAVVFGWRLFCVGFAADAGCP